MSSTRSGPRQLAEEVGKTARDLAGKIRRMIVTRTNSARYQVQGHDLDIIGGDVETHEADVFGGVGFEARPSEDSVVEAIVLFPGGGGNPIITQQRQEAVRRALAKLAADESRAFNTLAVVHIKADGTIEIKEHGGTAQRLTNETYRSAEDTLIVALDSLMTVLAAHANIGGASPDPTLLAAVGVFKAAIATFRAANATYLTTVAKGQ